MKKKIFIILTGVLVLSLVMVGVVKAYQGPTLVLDGPSEPIEEDNDELICSGEVTHPVLKRLVELNFEEAEVEDKYDELLAYFCESDLGIGEIKHALETAKIAEEKEITFEDEEPVTYETLLQMFIGGMDWGEIWQELGLIGFGGFDNEEDDEMGEEDDDEEMNPICSPETDFEHPALLGLAEDYGFAYTELVAKFCEGFGVGEIKLALQTAEKTEDQEDLWSDYLDMRKGEEEMGWGEIWQELGLIGKDKEKDKEPGLGSVDKGKPENHPGKGKGLDKKP